MLHQPNLGKPFQAILIVLILGMTSACEYEPNRLASFRVAESRVLKFEQRALAAEVRMNEMSRKLQEAEKAKAVAIEARQVAEQQRDKAISSLTFHKVISVISAGMIVVAFVAGRHLGRRRRSDSDAIRKSSSDDPYIAEYPQVTNTGTYKPRSARS